jgi:hypothetical protein
MPMVSSWASVPFTIGKAWYATGGRRMITLVQS